MIDMLNYINDIRYKRSNELEYLYEMPIGIPGEYNFTSNRNLLLQIGNMFKRMKLDKSRVVQKIFLKSLNKYVNIIIFEDVIFMSDESINDLLAFIIISDKENIHKNILNKYSPLIKISTSVVFKKYRNKGIMKFLYQYLIDAGIHIMSDEIQYESARKMWLNMNKIEEYRLDFVDIENGDVIKPDIKLENIYNRNIWHLVNSEPEGFKARDLGLKYIFERLIIYKR